MGALEDNTYAHTYYSEQLLPSGCECSWYAEYCRCSYARTCTIRPQTPLVMAAQSSMQLHVYIIMYTQASVHWTKDGGVMSKVARVSIGSMCVCSTVCSGVCRCTLYTVTVAIVQP